MQLIGTLEYQNQKFTSVSLPITIVNITPMSVRTFLSSLFIVGIFSQGSVYAEKLPPVDEGATDPSFKTFREQLLAAAKRRDKEFIFSISAPNIKYTFGRGDGLTDFKKYSGFSKPNDPVWGELIDVLTLGGTFKRTEDGKRYFCTPYVFCRDSRDIGKLNGQNISPFDYVAILKPNTPIRQNPKTDAPVVEALSYDIVKYDRSYRNPTWAKITTPTGKSGYVLERDVRSPIDYRAFFAKVNGKWTMTLFIAGD
jgi:hypothetical protein